MESYIYYFGRNNKNIFNNNLLNIWIFSFDFKIILDFIKKMRSDFIQDPEDR